MSIITKIDFLSAPVNIKINGEDKAKSGFGAFMSILFFILSLTLFILLGKELFERKNPMSSSSDIQTEESKVYLKDFPISFHISDSRGRDITEQVIEKGLIRATAYSNSSSGKTGNLRRLSFVQCSKQVVGKYFETINALKEGKYCIHPSKSTEFMTNEVIQEDIYFSKGFLEADSESITISVLKGENFIPGHLAYYFSLNTIENILDERDYANPIKYSLSSTNRQFTINSQLKLEPVIQVNKLFTDKGWLTTEEEEQSYFSNLMMKEFITPIEGNPKDSLVRIELTSSKLRKERFREYLKIPGLLANFGGVLKIIKLVFFGIMKVYSEFVVFDYVWTFKREDIKNRQTSLEIRNKKDFKGKLSLCEFLNWKIFMRKPSVRLASISRYIELDSFLDKGSFTEESQKSRFKLNLSSNHLVNS